MWDEVSDEEDVVEGSGDEEIVVVEEIVWCEACSKGYRSGGAWENHERSRKHVKNVERCVRACVRVRPRFHRRDISLMNTDLLRLRLIREMQLEDEELGLGTSSAAGHTPAVGDDSEAAPPVASTSRSPPSPPPPPSRHKIATAKDAAALAESLADLDLSTHGGGDGARSDDDNDDDDEANWTAPTAAPTKKSKKKQRKKAQIVPGFDDNDDDDEVLGDSGPVSDVDLTDVIGMAPSGGRRKNKKGKGRQGARVASGAAAEGDDDVAGAASVSDQAGAEDEEARSAPVKKGISRSRARSPTLPPPGAGLEEGDGREPSLGVDGSDADEAKSSTQLSKKEKRRLKEAAKKATASGGGGAAEEVVRALLGL